MKKTIFFIFIMPAVLSAVSCKSAPPAEPEAAPVQENSDARFSDAYEAVLPVIYDGAQNYTVKPGDTFTRISRSFYGRGNEFFFPLIMAASKERQTVEILDPDLIETGMELVVPDLEINLAHPEIRARIKALLESVAGIYEGKQDKNWGLEVCRGLSSAAREL
jgi:hypothetical protein